MSVIVVAIGVMSYVMSARLSMGTNQSCLGQSIHAEQGSKELL